MNAKDELTRAVSGTDGNITCAVIEYCHCRGFSEAEHRTYVLTEGHSTVELDAFLDSLDFKYDNSYGSQELFGTVWLSDGTWLERGEYDGSEWWEHRERPSIPEELRFKVKNEFWRVI